MRLARQARSLDQGRSRDTQLCDPLNAEVQSCFDKSICSAQDAGRSLQTKKIRAQMLFTIVVDVEDHFAVAEIALLGFEPGLWDPRGGRP